MPALPSSPLVRRSPEARGIPPQALTALADRLQDEGLDPHALLVARGGEVVFEAAWAPYRLDRPALVYSASKTYTSLAIGFLADEGRLGLDDSVGGLLGEPNPHGLTVRHLLTMNTGHTGDQIGEFEALGDDPLALLHSAPAHAPGTFFAYNSPSTYTLSMIVTAVTGQRLTEYLRPRLLDPLGIGERWMSSIGGVETGASGYHLTVEDLARTASMLAAGGVWEGVQVVPAWYVDEMSRPWSVTAEFDGPAAAEGEVNDWGLGYGYQVWRSVHGFRLDGAAGQFGLVLPDERLVIAYQGATLDAQSTLRAFWAFVDAVAISDAAGGPLAGGTDLALASDRASAPEHRDSWDARDRISTWSGVPFDADGLALTDEKGGWTLALPGVGELPVGDHWREAVCATPENPAEPGPSAPDTPRAAEKSGDANARPTHLALATRGETRADGSVLIHVVSTTSPHRAIVRRDPGGALHAGWHVPPLGAGWDAVRVPPSVTRVSTDAAALLLDMDGTLVDSHAVVERVWTQWSLAHGIDPARTLAVIHGRQGHDSMAVLLPDRPHEVNLAENAEMLALETAETDGVVAVPGAARLLADLDGLPHALVTSATVPLARARMGAAGLPMPALAVTAEDVTRSKPDPEGFVAAAALLGVDPADCIVVEDSANGIAAGLAAGMRVIGIGPHTAGTGATWAVPDARGIRISAGDDGRIAVTIGA